MMYDERFIVLVRPCEGKYAINIPVIKGATEALNVGGSHGIRAMAQDMITIMTGVEHPRLDVRWV